MNRGAKKREGRGKQLLITNYVFLGRAISPALAGVLLNYNFTQNSVGTAHPTVDYMS